MGFDDCYQLGNVVKTHGLKGELVFFLDVDDPSAYEKMESVLLDINRKLVPFFIESLQLNGDRAIVALEDITTLDDARELVGASLWLPLNKLPKLKKGQYYYHELIGMEVYDGANSLGKVTEVFELPSNHLLGVDHEGKELLIPIQDEILKEVNTQEGKIIAELPDGFLDIYLNP